MINIDSKFKFVDGQGLFFEEKLLIESNVLVLQKKKVLNSNNESRNEYLVRAIHCDGRPTVDYWVKDLKNIDFWKFEINDALMSLEDRNLLIFKLMYEAQKLTAQMYLENTSGLKRIEEDTAFFLGQHILLPQNKELENVIFKSQYSMTISENLKIQTISSCLNMLPGVTEVLFYSSLYAIVKPFLKEQEGFINALVGPPGHLKTSLVRKYALWLDDTSHQEIGFYLTMRNDVLLNLLEVMSGQNFLIDDLRRVEDRVENMRQQKRLESLARHVHSVGECANVFITGESLADMGIFSCIDRTLQIKIPQMNIADIEALKKRMSAVPDDFMRNLAFIFAERLMTNYHEVLSDIKGYYERNMNAVGQTEGYVTRIRKYAMFLKMTRFLFCKYCPECERGTDDDQAFDQALESQLTIQNAELQSLSGNMIKPDYVIDLFKILDEGKEINIIHDRKKYLCDDSSCCVYQDKVYFTTKALEKVFLNHYGHYVNVKDIVRKLDSKGVLERESSSKGFQKNFKGKKHYVINVPVLIYYLTEQGYSVTQELLNIFGVKLK